MKALQAAGEDPGRFLAANWELHRRIAAITRNNVLLTIYLSLLDMIGAQVTAVLAGPRQDKETEQRLRVHQELVDAIAANDVPGARRAAKRHSLVVSGSR